LAKLGAVTAGVNPRLAPPERAAVLARTDAAHVLGDAVELDRLVRDHDGQTPPALRPDDDRPVAIVFTSGTTGEPKGAVFASRQLAAIGAIDAGDRWGGGAPMLASTQLVHVGFMTKLPWYLRLGSRIHLLARWRAEDALRLISEQRMVSVGGVAPQVALMLRVPDFESYDLSAVRSIVMGGGPSPPALVREARARFGAAYSIRYSSTESGGVGTATELDAADDEALHTVGRPRPGVEVRIADDGEVWLRSPAVMTGYWRDPAATADALVDGWLRTSDLGELDDHGRLRLIGRTDDMYIRGGYNVHPAEVESVLLGHAGVTAVAVVAQPDDVMGEIGVAVVVPADRTNPPQLHDLQAWCDDRLAAYKVPEVLRIVDALPMTTMHKIDRRALRGS
jgi:acyl-CoA synthetase (AMP-forming)/AMP-acid ligase II